MVVRIVFQIIDTILIIMQFKNVARQLDKDCLAQRKNVFTCVFVRIFVGDNVHMGFEKFNVGALVCLFVVLVVVVFLLDL